MHLELLAALRQGRERQPSLTAVELNFPLHLLGAWAELSHGLDELECAGFLVVLVAGDLNDTINRMESEWTMADFNVARELHGDIPKLNKVAIGMTAATGACLALMIGGLFIDTDDETPEPATATVSPTPGGVTVSF